MPLLKYRETEGITDQQNAIDKAKGIVCKPMPREWYDRHAVNKIEDQDKRDLYRRIVADKKPYFMRYIYPTLMKQYNTYIKNTERNALREFQMTVSELKAIPIGEATDRQRDFIRYYDYRMPVGIHDCVMNRICRRFEEEFDGYVGRHNSSTDFDYTIMRSGADYTPRQYAAIKRLYEEYNKRLASYSMFANYERVDACDSIAALTVMNSDFREECNKICSSRQTLCNIILDICYSKNSTKRFAWSMCGTDIIHNLLEANNNLISFPVVSEHGDFHYCGETYDIETTMITIGGIE